MAKLQIFLPDEIIKKYNVRDGDKFQATLSNNIIKLKKLDNKNTNLVINKKKFNVIWMLLTSIISTLIYYIYIRIINIHQIPLTGKTSIASILIVIGSLSGMIMFSIYFIYNRKRITTKYSAYTFWRTFPVIVISFVLILSLILMIVSWGMGRIFIGVTFGIKTSLIIFFLFILIINYLMVKVGISVNYEMLTTMMILVIISGGTMSMASNGRNWWQHNISFLGTKYAHNSWQFNLTVVFSSLLMIALVDYIFVSFRNVVTVSWKTMTLKILLILTAANLGLVGIFPNNVKSHDIHVDVSTDLVYLIIILILSIRWLLPEVGERFLFLSYFICIGLVIMDIMFKWLHLISLTAFELSACLLSFGWIMVLFNTMISIIEDFEKNNILNIEIEI